MWTRLLFVEVTDASDGVSHRVAQAVYDEGVATGEGRYVALCGKLVLAAAMATQPGKPCALCVATIKAQL